MWQYLTFFHFSSPASSCTNLSSALALAQASLPSPSSHQSLWTIHQKICTIAYMFISPVKMEILQSVSETTISKHNNKTSEPRTYCPSWKLTNVLLIHPPEACVFAQPRLITRWRREQIHVAAAAAAILRVNNYPNGWWEWQASRSLVPHSQRLMSSLMSPWPVFCLLGPPPLWKWIAPP